MSTAQAHVSADELAKLNKPKRDGRYWAGAIGGIAGISVHHPVLRPALLLDGRLVAAAAGGRS